MPTYYEALKKITGVYCLTDTHNGKHYIAWCCSKHISNITECSMQFIRDEDIKTAFVTMMNKLIFGQKFILRPLFHGLRNQNNAASFRRIEELETKIENNMEQSQVLTGLMAKGYLEPALFNKEKNALEAERERLLAEKDQLTRSVNGNFAKVDEVDRLLKFATKSKMLTAYEDELFEDYVERMIATKFSQQSTIGMSFYLKKDTKHIMADISWGDYIKSSEKCTNEKGEEKISLVATVPPAFSLKTKRIQNVVEDLIKNAKKSILLTGYSVSEFVSEMIDTLVEKSQKGVLIRIFFNDIKSQVSIEKILRYRSKFLQVYNYTNKEDKMAALHAKILMVDDVDILISSANLSYQGMAGNIEIGTQVCSEKIAKQINELFKQLLFSKVFTAVNE